DILFNENFRNRRTEVSLPGRYRPYRRQNFRFRRCFEQVSACAAFQGAQHIAFIGVHAYHDDARQWKFFPDVLRRIGPVQTGHRYVEQDDVRCVQRCQFGRFISVRALPDNIEFATPFQKGAQSATDKRMIVNYQNPGRPHISSILGGLVLRSFNPEIQVTAVFNYARQTTILLERTVPARKAMFDFAARLRLLSRRNPTSEVAEAPEGKNTLRLLLVTRDDDLGCSVQNAAARCGWQMRLVRSVEQNMPVLDEFRAPLVIYDWNPAEGDWRLAVDWLTARPDHPCVLLASAVVDQYLWAELVRHGGFEMIPRSANMD